MKKITAMKHHLYKKKKKKWEWYEQENLEISQSYDKMKKNQMGKKSVLGS